MSDKFTLIASAALVAFFFASGLLDILDNLVIKVLLFAGFFAIIINIIMLQSRKEGDQKNPSK